MSYRRRSEAARVLLAALLVLQLACGGGSLSERFGRGGGGTGAKPAPHFKPGFNLFTPEQDIELGKRSAQQIARETPFLNDPQTVEYVRRLGARLAAKAPGYKFPYHFEVVASREINAFALPGGFAFVNAGAIAAAKNEGELAGVIAHEISHVALRHGTSQATKAYIAQKGLDVLSVITGDGGGMDLGTVIASIGGAGANMLFLKFGRTAETQADLEGARIMAEAGYDPRDMANFFKTLAAQGGQRTPEMMSDHPDPGNRYAAINEAVPSLPLSEKPVRDTEEFRAVKARLTGAAIGRGSEPQRLGPRDPSAIEPGARPSQPSAAMREFRARDNSFAFLYPENWDALSAGDNDANLIFAPKGAYGERDGAVYVTHGMFAGVVEAQARDLAAANDAFVRQQIQVNSDFSVRRAPERVERGGRTFYVTVVAGPSAVTGVLEVDVIYTTATADGRLFYLITMAPEDEFETYQKSFEQVIASLQLAR
ncbi:MAG TPA: M48 family metalloprotease [Pyrinomonadaceae bacterium]|nr:M48 family metalloprotease [Pyrinomonadaceae bacterium]